MSGPPPPAVQPPLIAGLVNAVLVFCGLVVAGALSVLSGSAGASLAEWAVVSGLAAVAAALVGGLAALVGMLLALNLARAVEKRDAAPDDVAKAAFDPSIKSYRYWAATWSEGSFWSCAVASLAVGTLLFGFVNAGRAISWAAPEVRVVLRTTQGLVELKGGLRQVRVSDPAGVCVLYLDGDVTSKAPQPPCGPASATPLTLLGQPRPDASTALSSAKAGHIHP